MSRSDTFVEFNGRRHQLTQVALAGFARSLVQLDEAIPRLTPAQCVGVLAACLEAVCGIRGLCRGVALCCPSETEGPTDAPDARLNWVVLPTKDSGYDWEVHAVGPADEATGQVVVFSGLDARQRAEGYAVWMLGQSETAPAQFGRPG
jgi:hypothetical protein